jgi:hypothetical protein
MQAVEGSYNTIVYRSKFNPKRLYVGTISSYLHQLFKFTHITCLQIMTRIYLMRTPFWHSKDWAKLSNNVNIRVGICLHVHIKTYKIFFKKLEKSLNLDI